MKAKDLVEFIYNYFGQEEIKKAQAKDTYGANGLQVLGAEEVSGVALGVSASGDFFQQAVQNNLNFLIVHHGLGINDLGFRINEILKQRLKFLFDHNLTLMGFHYLLDSHRELGNNAQILTKLGAKIVRPFDDDWGWVGELEAGVGLPEVVKRCHSIFNSEPVSFLQGKETIKNIAVVSGGGKLHPYTELTTEIMEGIDLYITGEAGEQTQALCREGKINYLAYGHYNTEVFGVKALGEVVRQNFPGLEVKFIEISNSL